MVGLAGAAGGRRSAASDAVSGTHCTCMGRSRESAPHTENTSCPHTSCPRSAQNGCTYILMYPNLHTSTGRNSTLYTPTRDASCLACHGRHSISPCARIVSSKWCQPLVAPPHIAQLTHCSHVPPLHQHTLGTLNLIIDM